MKSTISKIMGVGLTVMLLASTIVVAMPKETAKAATLEWSAVTLPSATGNRVRGISSALPAIIAVSPDGSTIFATNSTNGTVYRSTNGGTTFSQTAGTGTPGWNDGTALTFSSGVQVKNAANVRQTAIAVSPTFAVDKTVVVATFAVSAGVPNAGLYKSTDGGANFIQITANLTTGEYFSSIALSPNYATDGLLLAATAAKLLPGFSGSLGVANGNVYQMGKAGTFGLNAVVAAPGRDFFAVAFSPNYAGDRTILAVGADAADTRLLVNVNWGTTWGSFTGMTDTGAIFITSPSTNATLSRASLALPSDFQGFDTSKRVVYVSRVVTGATGNVTRSSFGATTSTTADIFPNSEGEIHSLSYSGTTAAGTLFAGAHSGTGVFRVANPTSATTAANWVNADKLPTGSANVTAVAAPDFATSKKVYAMTEGANGGFAVSTDGGAVFTEFSLINTSVNQVKTFEPSPNYNADKVIYLTTTDNGTSDADSVWHSADGGSSWHRYFSTASANDRLIVRLSPAYATDKTVVVAEAGAIVGGNSRIWKSTNAGITWTQLLSSMTEVNDIVVEDTNTFYEAGMGTPSGSASAVATVLKSVGGADFSVAPTFSSGLSGAPFSLSGASNGDLFMGTTDGRVYQSTDKGLTWASKPSTTITGISNPNVAGSNVMVVPDSAYATNKVIYAISTSNTTVPEGTGASAGGQIQRLVVGTSTAWEAIDADASLNPLSGIASVGGILYASDSSPASASNGGVRRSANPTGRVGSADAPMFETVATGDGLVTNNSTTSAVRFVGLAVASGNATTGNTVFAIDEAVSDTFPAGFTDPVVKGAFRVMTYSDTFMIGPTLSTPAVTSKVPSPALTTVDKATLTWKAITAPAAFIPTYEVQVNTSKNFDGTTVVPAFPGADATKTTVDLTLLEGGKQYFWRVRALTPVRSNWSVTWAFTTALATPAPTITELVPKSGATDADVNPIFTWPAITDATYEFQIGEDPTFGILLYAATSPINTHAARETLAYSTTYYWRVRAVTATAKSAWTTAIFTTKAKPVAPTPPVTITPPAAPAAPQIVKVEVPVPIPQPIPSYLLWAVIIIGGILIVAVIILIVRTRRVS